MYYRQGLQELYEFNQKEPAVFKNPIPDADHRFEALRSGVLGCFQTCQREFEQLQQTALNQAPEVAFQSLLRRFSRLQGDVSLFFDSFQVNDFSIASYRLEREKLSYLTDYQR